MQIKHHTVKPPSLLEFRPSPERDGDSFQYIYRCAKFSICKTCRSPPSSPHTGHKTVVERTQPGRNPVAVRVQPKRVPEFPPIRTRRWPPINLDALSLSRSNLEPFVLVVQRVFRPPTEGQLG